MGRTGFLEGRSGEEEMSGEEVRLAMIKLTKRLDTNLLKT